MNKFFITLLKIIVPLALGLFLIWLAYNQLTPEQITRAKNAVYEMNYFYLFLSMILGILSHFSRAWRWKYPLAALGYQPKFWNSFFTVMIGYFVNLGIPRSGEVLRCGIMSKYEKIPFNKLIGTVIAERIIDFILLIVSIFIAFLLQAELIAETISYGKEKFTTFNIGILIGIVILFIIGAIFLKKISGLFYAKLKDFVNGIFEGIKTIITMDKKWLFIFHTLFMWVMYFMMFRVTFYGLEELNIVPFAGIFPAFVVGGLSIVLTNGGIGAYPLGISAVLAIYGLKDVGYGFGWAVWVAQSVMIILGGLVSFLLIPRFNAIKST